MHPVPSQPTRETTGGTTPTSVAGGPKLGDIPACEAAITEARLREALTMQGGRASQGRQGREA